MARASATRRAVPKPRSRSHWVRALTLGRTARAGLRLPLGWRFGLALRWWAARLRTPPFHVDAHTDTMCAPGEHHSLEWAHIAEVTPPGDRHMSIARQQVV